MNRRNFLKFLGIGGAAAAAGPKLLAAAETQPGVLTLEKPHKAKRVFDAADLVTGEHVMYRKDRGLWQISYAADTPRGGIVVSFWQPEQPTAHDLMGHRKAARAAVQRKVRGA